MTDAVARIREARLIAILRRVPPKDLEHVVDALRRGGVRVIEITLDSDSALEQIARVRREDDELLVVAGTVQSSSDVDAAVNAGAELCTSPTTRAEVVERCRELGVAAIPGALTPAEIVAAWELGAPLVKLFPARAVGPDYVRDLSGPLPHIPVVATGGVDAKSAPVFLRAGAIAVGIGSSLVSSDGIASRDWQAIERAAASVVGAARV